MTWKVQFAMGTYEEQQNRWDMGWTQRGQGNPKGRLKMRLEEYKLARQTVKEWVSKEGRIEVFTHNHHKQTVQFLHLGGYLLMSYLQLLYLLSGASELDEQ